MHVTINYFVDDYFLTIKKKKKILVGGITKILRVVKCYFIPRLNHNYSKNSKLWILTYCIFQYNKYVSDDPIPYGYIVYQDLQSYIIRITFCKN